MPRLRPRAWILYWEAAALIGGSRYDVGHLVRTGWIRGKPDLRGPAMVRKRDALAWAPPVAGRWLTQAALGRQFGPGAGARIAGLARAGAVRVHQFPGCPTLYLRADCDAALRTPARDPEPRSGAAARREAKGGTD